MKKILRLLCILAASLKVSAFTTLKTTGRSSLTTTQLSASIGKGDTVLVIGGTGGVGQLVTQKLANNARNVSVRVASRDVQRGQETIANDAVNVVEVDLVNGSKEQLQSAMQGIQGLVISVGTTAFPTMKWRGGNTPEAIDKIAVTRIAQAASQVETLKKVVLLTSIGVDRTDSMPFLILNLFGVLDAKKAGEEAIKQASKQGSGYEYSIVRPGRLVGGPFTNADIAALLKVQGGAENGVDVEAGDTLLGDCKRDSCAEAVVQCLLNEECKNVEFSIVSNEEKALTEEEWTSAFMKMERLTAKS